MTFTRIKICGITNPEDAAAAIGCGVDALGFNTWTGSKRYLNLETAAKWIAALPPFVVRVAVMVNPKLEEAERVLALPFIDRLQLHGDETPEFCEALARRGAAFVKAIGVSGKESLRASSAFCTSDLLLDAHAPGVYGGTGETIDWKLCGDFVRNHPGVRTILSGGLNPENVGRAIQEVRPFAVDVASGVERSPGRKDAGLIRAFVAAVSVGERSQSA